MNHVLTGTREIAVSPRAGPLGDFSGAASARGSLHPHPIRLRSSNQQLNGHGIAQPPAPTSILFRNVAAAETSSSEKKFWR